ncbi:MAG: hypothetical protein ACTSRC_05800 [Candidatus Helarchaeota archaeon]
MQKRDIELLWELEASKQKRLHQRMISKEDLHITALDYNDEIIIIRSKIKELTDTGIIVITNPDRAEKDGELYELLDLNALKLVIFTFSLTEANILALLEVSDDENEDFDYIEE